LFHLSADSVIEILDDDVTEASWAGEERKKEAGESASGIGREPGEEARGASVSGGGQQRIAAYPPRFNAKPSARREGGPKSGGRRRGGGRVLNMSFREALDASVTSSSRFGTISSFADRFIHLRQAGIFLWHLNPDV